MMTLPLVEAASNIPKMEPLARNRCFLSFICSMTALPISRVRNEWAYPSELENSPLNILRPSIKVVNENNLLKSMIYALY